MKMFITTAFAVLILLFAFATYQMVVLRRVYPTRAWRFWTLAFVVNFICLSAIFATRIYEQIVGRGKVPPIMRPVILIVFLLLCYAPPILFIIGNHCLRRDLSRLITSLKGSDGYPQV
jgi:hypothetical protein